MGLSMSYVHQLEAGKRTPSESVITLVRMIEMDASFKTAEHSPTLQEECSSYRVETKLRTIPIIGWAHAGEACSYDEIPFDWQEKMTTDCPKEGVFAVRLEGDSMEPKFSDGDILILMSQERAHSGSFAVVKFKNDGVLFRRIEFHGERVRLMPTNERYDATDHSLEEFLWIYPVWGRFTQMWKR